MQRKEIIYAPNLIVHLLLALCVSAMMFLVNVAAQTTTSGDITGVVTDQSGAVLPAAKLTLVNVGNGSTQTTTSDSQGTYRISLLGTGAYTLTASATGFAPKSAHVQVNIGQVATADFRLQVGTTSQTVTVTAEAAPVQTDNGNIATTFTAQQVTQLPNPGNDLTAAVQTTPGAVMNTQAGYGNFSTFGLPATSNLFTVNGQEDNDPFLNLNNSGATNLSLGLNDVQQITVTNNGYSGLYGQLGGANVSIVTKSGSNDWHGNAIYYWNGRTMNANNFFNNASGTPRAFDNVNQWAWSIGGPIVKNKTFFWVDQEGLYVLLPTNTQVLIPSPQYQAATLTNLAATGNTASVPFYNQMFALYNGANGASSATPVPGGGCGAFAGLPGGVPCALEFRSNAGNRTHEWILAARLDQVISGTDRLFFRFETDQGVQASFTDPISPAFNITSTQPQYSGQMNWTHSVSSSAVNQFVGSASHYDAVFGENPEARAAVLPATITFTGNLFTPLGGEDFEFPQGRNVTQYGLVDDFSLVKGNQTIKAGVNYRLNMVNDFDFGFFTTPAIGTGLTNFFSGQALNSTQSFPENLNQPIRLYTLGGYLEDDFRVTPNLKVNLTLRLEHDSNPVCTHDCISRLTQPFNQLSHDPTVPYDAVIDSGLTQAYPSYDSLLWQPRIGFAWTPMGANGVVVRGGIGLFNDIFPATLVDDFAENAPLDNTFVVSGPISPAAPANVFTNATSANASFRNAFSNGGTLASITATNPAFSPPSFTSSDAVVKAPQYQEWNLELQHAIGQYSSISANYVGNHGIHETIQNGGLNAFFPGFAGLPTVAPDLRFGTITQIQTSGVSNYNGLTISVQSHMSQSLQIQANYTWSHTLDEVSNGGFLPFNFNTNFSLVGVQDPYNVREFNYGNADYDIRQYFSLSYVWQVPFTKYAHHWGSEQIWKGWVVSGTLYTRSGVPLTVFDGAATSALVANNYADGFDDAIFANQLGWGQNGGCIVDKQCLFPQAFSAPNPTPAGFGDQIRNQLRGPRFFDTDMSVIKNTQFPGWEKGQLGLGVQFFNLFNHPNFDQPVQDVSSAQFGTIINTASVPTSILGSFLGGDASPRIIQLTARVTF